MPFVMPKPPTGPRGSVRDFQSRVTELEQLQQQLGAPQIEQNKPGVFSRIVDVLSRPNYAVAGLAEELLGDEPSVERGVRRALTEIFSGVGGLQGEKRAFGETLERLGVGTVTLADAFPALEGTWVGNFGSRGAAGLALDIATDPLTYMTFGASTGMKVIGKNGVRYVNKAGALKRQEIYRDLLQAARPQLDEAGDAIARTRVLTKLSQQADDKFLELYEQGGKVVDDFAEKGGAKLFGAQIPGTDQFGPAMKRALDVLPESVTKPVVEGATKMRDGMYTAMGGVFSKDGALRLLPPGIRDRAVQITDNFFRSSGAHRAHLLNYVDDYERRAKRVMKANKESAEEFGKRWYGIREGTLARSAFKSDEEMRLFDEVMGLYDSMGTTALEHGVLKDEQILPNYIFHQYKNAGALQQFHPRPGVKLDPGNKSKFQKLRRYETYEDAVEISTAMHEKALISHGKAYADRMYPVLEPEYDVFKNLRDYTGSHADAVARKAWSEEMVAQFGKQLDEVVDFDAFYDADLWKKAKNVKEKDWFNPENVPIRRAIDELDIEDELVEAFGEEGATYIAVKGAPTGDELVYLPREIAKTLESVNANLFNTRDYKDFGKLLKGYDWLNNNFKWGVYVNPIWIASRVRNAYSNMSQSALRIGVAAIDPRRHKDAVLLMAGRNLDKTFAGSGFTLRELRDQAKDLGVWVPGKVFTESVGKFNMGRYRRAITDYTAAVENESRVLLWLEEIRRGADPRQAADTVGEFLFNYGEMSKVERELFRRVIPFYTFTRKNVELQVKALKRNPGMVINQIKPFRQRDEEKEMMVKWEAEALAMRLNRDGKTVNMITGVDLPLRNLDNLWAGGWGSTGRRIMGMVSPLLKTPVELIADRDFFTGRELDRKYGPTLGRVLESQHTPKALKNWLGFKREVDDAGRPTYTFDGKRYHLLVNSWMFSRFLTSSDRQFREYAQDGNVAGMMLDFVTGLRRKDLNLDEQQMRVLRRRIRELEESLVRRGAMRNYTRSYEPKTRGELQ